jgi:hypothetical protein
MASGQVSVSGGSHRKKQTHAIKLSKNGSRNKPHKTKTPQISVVIPGKIHCRKTLGGVISTHKA